MNEQPLIVTAKARVVDDKGVILCDSRFRILHHKLTQALFTLSNFSRSWRLNFSRTAVIARPKVNPGRGISRKSGTKEVAALDLSPRMLELAERRRPDKRVRYGRGDVRRLPFFDNLFDAVVSTWTVELTAASRFSSSGK